MAWNRRIEKICWLRAWPEAQAIWQADKAPKLQTCANYKEGLLRMTYVDAGE